MTLPRAPAGVSDRVDWGFCALVFFGAVLPYVGSLDAPFVWDDAGFTESPLLRELPRFLPGREGWAAYPTRWLVYASFALNYRLGGEGAFGFHVTNVLVHGCAALVVYAVARRLLKVPGAVAALAALGFAVHPVQTEAVTYVSQRLASLATLFFVGSVAAYVRARSDAERGWPWTRSLGWHVLAWACAFAASKSKEIAFTLPVVVFLVEVMFFRARARTRVLCLLPFVLIAATIPLGYLPADPGPSGTLGAVSTVTRLQTDVPRGVYLVTEFRVIATYLRLLVWPVGLNLDYDFPLRSSLFQPDVFASLVFESLIVGLALFLWWRGRRLEDRRLLGVALGILWFFVTLSVESSLIPIADVIFEHRLYLPSVGAALALSAGAWFLIEPWGAARRRILGWVGAGTVVVLAAGTVARNELWRDEVRLWADAARKSPGKARPHYNLGTALLARGRSAEGIAALERAVRLQPSHAKAWDNLGVEYQRVGRLQEAEAAFQRAAFSDPAFPRPRYNLGRLYLTAFPDRASDAATAFEAAVSIDSGMGDAWVNLAGALLRLRETERAVVAAEKAVLLLPQRPDAHFNLAVALFMKNERARAAREAEATMRLSPELGRALNRYLGAPPE